MKTEYRGGTYVLRRHWANTRHNVDDCNRKCPDDRPHVHRHARPPQMKRSTLKFAKGQFTDDRDDVGPVERDGREVEAGGDGRVGRSD